MTDVTDGAWARMVSAVRTRLAELSWTQGQLARQASLNVDTVGDFLAGRRRPLTGTLAAIEEAVNWPKGTLAEIAAGAPLPVVDDGEPIGGKVTEVLAVLAGVPRERQLAILSAAIGKVVKAR